MMRAIDRLRRSVALLICPELAPLHAGGTVQGAPSIPVGANATEEAAAKSVWLTQPMSRFRAQSEPKTGFFAPLNDDHDQTFSVALAQAKHRASRRDLPPGWWILPAIILGAAMWTGVALAIGDVAGWL